MIRDPIVEEVRQIRRQTEEACQGDWQKLIEHHLAVQRKASNPRFDPSREQAPTLQPDEGGRDR